MRKIGKLLFAAIFFLGLGMLPISKRGVFAATPTVNSGSFSTVPSGSLPQVGRYQKIEATFQISEKFPAMEPVNNPPQASFLPYYYYDPSDNVCGGTRKSPCGNDGITIDAHFIPPSGSEMVVPAFYYQDFVRTKSGSEEVMTATSNYSWKVRFAPMLIGQYQYYLTLANKDGSSRYPSSGTLSFQSVSSTSKGFVRVSSRDSRFWQFDNGESYIPIGAGQYTYGPSSALRSYEYEDLFANFQAHGINLIRPWDQADGWALTVEGHFDGYSWPDDYRPYDDSDSYEVRDAKLEAIPKGTQMNQRGNYEEDKIIESAQANGVYLQLCPHSDSYWLWDKTTHDESYDPWTQRYKTTSTDPLYLNYWKRNFRYRVARWGYSTAILAWERWNEHGHVPTESDVYNFYQTYGQYQNQIDPYHHLRTTSQGSQAYSPGFWSSSVFDLVNYHDYMMISRYGADLAYNETNFVYRFAQCLRAHASINCSLGLGDGSNWNGPDKPIVWGELDTGTNNWNESNPQPIADHNVIWAGLFSPIGMAPIDWYFYDKDYLPQKYDWDKIAADFFSNVDYAGEKFDYLSTNDVRLTSEAITATNSSMRVLAMRSNNKTKAFAWVQHKNYTWGNGGTPSAISGSVTIPQMASGNYTVEYWNTETGQKTSGGTVSSSGGNVQVSVTGLNKSMAIKIISTSLPPATPTPLPTSSCPKGDVDGNCQVNAQDLTLIFSNWLGTGVCSGYNCNLNGEAKINGLDAGIVIANFGQ